MASRIHTRAETHEITDPTLFAKFQEGSCVVKKSKAKFSSIACDQAHEQTNKLIKSKSGLAEQG